MKCDICGKNIESNEICTDENVVESKLCRLCFAMFEPDLCQEEHAFETKVPSKLPRESEQIRNEFEQTEKGALHKTNKLWGLAIGILFFALAVAVGSWSILLSRSSTAAIGFLFLPFWGFLSGLLGWCFWCFKSANHLVPRGLAWCCLIGAFAIVVGEYKGGLETIEHNKDRDARQLLWKMEMDQKRAIIESKLKQNKGQESAVMDQFIREKGSDHQSLIVALENKNVPTETLDRFALDKNHDIARLAIRNPNCCRADTLVSVYRNNPPPNDFFGELAENPNTPPEILREIYQNPRPKTYYLHSFAKNSATPIEILLDISKKTTDVTVIQGLIQNPKLDCNLIGNIEAALRNSSRPDDNYSEHNLKRLKPLLCRSAMQADR